MKQPLKRRPFGATGEHVTEVSLGAMNLRLLDSEEDGVKVIHQALDLGINLIDTARAYSQEKLDGRVIESERIVNKALTHYRQLDEPIIVITKGHGYDIDNFDQDLAKSREMLGITTQKQLFIGQNEIKLVYFFHGLSQDRWDTIQSSGVLDHAKKLQEQGLFTYLGFSSHNGHEACIEAAIESGYFDVVELPYNVFSPSLHSLMQLAYEKGMGVINMKAFGGNGMVSSTKIFENYCDISPQKRLQFCLASPYISTVDAGCQTVDECQSDVETALLPSISQAECDELMALATKVSNCINNTCRECTHCLEKFTCPAGLNFPKILALHSHAKLAKTFNSDLAPMKEKYAALKSEADRCVACGQCNEWCEYKLDIPVLLAEAKAWLA
jgi:predicted aldo/keto reductase-like oxidoreductase